MKSTRQLGRTSGKAINDRPSRTPRQLTWIRPVNVASARNTTPATQPPAKVNSNLPAGRRPRPNPAARTSGQPANNNSGVVRNPVAMSTGIDYVNEPSSEPSDTTGLPARPSRDRRRPAHYLSTVHVSDAAADVGRDIAILETLWS